MSTRTHRLLVTSLGLAGACLLLFAGGGAPLAQTELPKIEVEKPKVTKRAPPPAKKQVARPTPAPAPRIAAPVPTPEQRQAEADRRQTEANRQVVERNRNFDQRRDNVILPKGGANNYELDQKDLENIPQGNAVQLSDLVLQFPGVYQDSTNQGDFHIRNEHGNVQYRVNGILLPDGVSGFAQILETSFIANLRLLTGARPFLPATNTAGSKGIPNISLPAAISAPASASRIPRRLSTPFTTIRNRAGSSATRPRCSIQRRG